MSYQDKLNSYIISFVIVLIVALVPRDVMKAVNSPWYKCIKPGLTPPNIVFPIVWTFLYICIAIVLAESLEAKTISKQQGTEKVILLSLFVVNLSLNMVWSFLYFGFKKVQYAFLCILVLIAVQTVVMVYVWRLLPRYLFYLLVPYTLWLCFAGLLNFLSMKKSEKCAKLL